MPSLVKRVKDSLSDNSKAENLVLLAAVSIFLPYVITAAVLIFVCIRAYLMKDFRQTLKGSKDVKIVGVFLLFNLFSPLFLKNYYGFFAAVGIAIMMLISLFCRYVMSEKLFEKISLALIFMSMCALPLALYQLKYVELEDPGRAPSIAFNPNYYGMLIEFVAILCLYRIITKKPKPVLSAVSLIVNLIGLRCCDCQSAVIAIAFALWLMLLLCKKNKAFIALSAVGVLTVVLAAVSITKLSFIFPRIDIIGENIERRLKIFKTGLRAFLDTPAFGRGITGYLQIYKKYGGPADNHCHNIIIDTLLSFGIIGAVPLYAFVIRALKKIKKGAEPTLLICLLAATALHSLVDITIVWIQTGLFAAIILSLPFAKKGENDA